MSNGFEEIVTQASPQVQELARRAKALVEAIMPDVVEVAWPNQSIISYGVGPRKMSEHFCYIGVFNNRINLGFYYGADLSDPAGLLEGTGKLLWHVKIAKLEQLENPVLRQLLEAATKHLPKLKS